ncbi:hypothetical protein TcasGA2_TC004809 [Tribolium castaneum]|uniref:Uncharacterized protein n=1 Tax=Tribolium castaneum TaxID=7070 RepID=D6WBG5_TRICA|nr:hypothetical protein TcasGA2_TC004809 [Tribolium castaneum]
MYRICGEANEKANVTFIRLASRVISNSYAKRPSEINTNTYKDLYLGKFQLRQFPHGQLNRFWVKTPTRITTRNYAEYAPFGTKNPKLFLQNILKRLSTKRNSHLMEKTSRIRILNQEAMEVPPTIKSARLARRLAQTAGFFEDGT